MVKPSTPRRDPGTGRYLGEIIGTDGKCQADLDVMHRADLDGVALLVKRRSPDEPTNPTKIWIAELSLDRQATRSLRDALTKLLDTQDDDRRALMATISSTTVQ